MAPEKPKGLFSFLLSGALKTGAIGAAAGGVAGLVLPFLSMPLGAMIGGVGGAILGAVQGVGKHKAAQENYKIAMQALNPSELGPQAGVDPYTPAPGEPAAGTPEGAAAAAASAAATAGPPKSSSGAKRKYVVKAGDTASAIAKRHKVSLAALVEANNMTMAKASRIHPGQKLVIPKRDS
jgi:LysM repeat protein